MMAKTKKKRGRPSMACAYEGPTPETLVKLQPDPLLALLRVHGGGDIALEHAADEIRAIFLAVCGRLMAGTGGLGGGGEMPDFLAWAHGSTYLPWARSLKHEAMEAIIDIVVDRRAVRADLAARAAGALDAYARRMKSRPAFRGDAV